MWDYRSTREGWRKCAPPFSFYKDLIERYWAGGPSEASGAPIHRICTLARKMGARSIIVEDGFSRSDVLEEIAHLQQWAQTTVGDVSSCVITFLSSGVRRGRDFAGVRTGGVIGQATIITFPLASGPRSYIFEAIFRLPGKNDGFEQLLNNHVPVSSDLALRFAGTEHRITASYFCQQNGITSICAHSAARSLVRTLTDQQISVSALNQLWSYNPETRSVSTALVQEALRHYGLRPIPYDLQQRSSDPDVGWNLAALLADSASPSLLVLSGTAVDHVVPILGHTINSDEWHPIGTTPHVQGEDSVSSSSLWTDHLVIHDDMLGPYYCLSKAGLLPKGDTKLKPKLVIAVLPGGVEVSPLAAEDFAKQILSLLLKDAGMKASGIGRWWKHLEELRERRVFRTTLIEKDTYLATLPGEHDLKGLKQKVGMSLPDRMWMSEISVPNVFLANRAKLGELLISSENFPTDEHPDAVMETLLAFRLPSLIGWADTDDDGSPVMSVGRWHETGHRPIHAPGHHQNWW